MLKKLKYVIHLLWYSDNYYIVRFILNSLIVTTIFLVTLINLDINLNKYSQYPDVYFIVVILIVLSYIGLIFIVNNIGSSKGVVGNLGLCY